MVDDTGLEPVTSESEARRSIQLKLIVHYSIMYFITYENINGKKNIQP